MDALTWRMFDPLHRKAYQCIVADPPWSFKSYTVGGNRAAERHYPVMSFEDLAALPVQELAAPAGCHLFLWTTGAHLPQAIELIRAWGFKYSGVAFTWIKLKKRFSSGQLRILPTEECDLHLGLGLTTRKNSEICLLARRGNCRRYRKDVREVIMAPVRQHSRKPDEFRNRVAAYVGPEVRVVELFARSRFPEWEAWGNEIDRFDMPVTIAVPDYAAVH